MLTFIILVYSSLDKSENCFLNSQQFSKPWYVHTSEMKHFKRSVILQLNYLVNVTKTLEVMPHEYSWSNLKFFRANTKAQQFSDNVDSLDCFLASDWLIKSFLSSHWLKLTNLWSLMWRASIHDLLSLNKKILIFIQNFHTLSF